MTVDATLIAAVSPYTVSATGDFSSTDLATYLAIAKARLEAQYPGLSAGMGTALYEYCCALMVCHIYAVKSQNTDLSMEKVGGAGSSFAASRTPGETKFSLECKAVIADWTATQVDTLNEGVERCDADMSALGLDQSTVPAVFDTDSVDAYDDGGL